MKNKFLIGLIIIVFAQFAKAQDCPFPPSSTVEVIVVWNHPAAEVHAFLNMLNAQEVAHTTPSNAYLIRMPACGTVTFPNGSVVTYQGLSGAVGVVEGATGSVGSGNDTIYNPSWSPTDPTSSPEPLPSNLFGCSAFQSEMQERITIGKDRPGSYPVKVAILDTGCGNITNLNDKIGDSYNCILDADPTDVMDKNGHGTSTASVLLRFMGTDDRFLIYKVLDDSGIGKIFDAIVAIDKAIQKNAAIISASWISNPHYSTNSPLSIAIENARNANILVVTASGNDSRDIDLIDQNFTVPAGLQNSNIITVGSLQCGINGSISSFSNYGQQTVDIFASGERLLVWNHDGRVVTVSGTSFATPLVTAVALQLWQKVAPASRNVLTLRQAILNSAIFSQSVKDKCVSKGILNAPSAACLFFGDCHTRLNVNVLLQGAYNAESNKMNDNLRADNLIPLNEPYTAQYEYRNNNQNETTTTNILSTYSKIPIDWVLVELRSPTTPSTILYTKAALVTAEGVVVEADGSGVLDFTMVDGGSFHISVRHRNHLGIQTALPVQLTDVATLLNFANGSTATYGTNAQKQEGTKYLMWAGDASGDGRIKYNGSGNDRGLILTRLNGVQAAQVSGYYSEDINMDGRVKYNGLGNDRAVILSNLNGNQVATIIQQF